jgi:hypothetical protein
VEEVCELCGKVARIVASQSYGMKERNLIPVKSQTCISHHIICHLLASSGNICFLLMVL